MRYHRRSFSPRARRALLWGLCAFAGLQLGLALAMERWQPELRDPEYGYKLLRLRERLSENPDRPLMLVIGSSRTGQGFSPEAVAACLPAGRDTPLVFNFAITGSGPMLEKMMLRRLLAAGIHPHWLVLEVMPPLLHQEGQWVEPLWLNVNRLGWEDLPVLRENTSQPWTWYRHWVRSRLVPWYSHRYCVLNHYARDWLPWNAPEDGWKNMDRSGWIAHCVSSVTPEQYRIGRDFAFHEYEPVLCQFHVSNLPKRNLRQILDLCRRQHITPMLLVMPEGSDFRSWYTPEAVHEINAYLAGLCQEYHMPLIDARCWLTDGSFHDSHHLLPSGALAFSRRFAEEAVRPLLQGKALAAGPSTERTGSR